MHYFRQGKVSTEVDVPELAGMPNGYPTMHIWIIGTMARIIGGVKQAWMLAHALFPAAVWLLFALMYQWQNLSWYVSCAASSITVWLPMGPRNALFLGPDALIQPMELTRTPHPSLSLALLLVFVLTMTQWVRNVTWKGGLLPACLFASLFFTYYFMWLGACMAICFFMMLLIMTKQWKAVLYLIGMSILSGLLALPYLFRVSSGISSTTSLGGALPLMQRVGSFTHEVNFLFLIIAFVTLSIVIFVYHHWKSQRQNYILWFSACLVIAGLFGLNLQTITGYNAQHEHFMNRVVQPFGCFIAISGILILTKDWVSKIIIQRISLIVMLVILTASFLRQTMVAENTCAFHKLSDDRQQALAWIRDHSKDDSVIGTMDEQLLTLIPTVTGAWSFVPLSDRSMASHDETLLRYCCVARLLGLSLDTVLKHLSLDLGGDKNYSSTGYVLLSERLISQTSLDWVRHHYECINPIDVLATRRLDYIIFRSIDVHKLPDAFEEVCSINTWRVLRNTQ